MMVVAKVKKKKISELISQTFVYFDDQILTKEQNESFGSLYFCDHLQNKHDEKMCPNDFQSFCSIKNKESWDTMLGQFSDSWGHVSFRKQNFPCSHVIRLFFPPLTSLCSWRDQPLLGTLVVVTLQLPCERKVVMGKDGRGEKRKGWIKTPSKGQSDLSESSRPAD